MLYRIDRLIPSKRALCAGGALACFAAAFVLAPSSVRSQLAPPADPPVPRALMQRAAERAIAPARDAFAPQAPVEDDTRPIRSAEVLPPMPSVRPAPDTAHRAGTLRVEAIITGDAPTAIVDDGGATQTVALGDPLAGSHVTAIRAGAINLADGRHIALVQDVETP